MLSEVADIRMRKAFEVLRTEFYSDLWRRAAHRVDAKAVTSKDGLLEIRRGGFATFVHRSDVMLDDSLTIRLMAHKALLYELAAAKDFRIPEHRVYTIETIEQAQAFLRGRPGGVVVKPADGTGGGRGVTTGIYEGSGLLQASRFAAGFHPELIVEEQLVSPCYRLLYIDAAFIDAVRRDSPQITGDGAHTIRELVDRENYARYHRRPLSALSPLSLDRDARNTLAARGLTTSTRPRAGESVRVKTAVNQNAAPQNHVVREDVHSDLVEAGARLVRDLGVRFAGIDVFSEDISAPMHESGTHLSEVNVNPGIHHHYLVADPEKGIALAEIILDRLFTCHRGVVL